MNIISEITKKKPRKKAGNGLDIFCTYGILRTERKRIMANMNIPGYDQKKERTQVGAVLTFPEGVTRAQVCEFLDDLLWVRRNFLHLQSEKELVDRFRKYLRNQADDENDGIEAVCENCGKPCDYHSYLCLCDECRVD